MRPYNNSNDYGTTSSSIITLTILSLLLCHVKPIKGHAANVIDYGRRCLNMRINEQQNSQDGTTCPHITSNTIHEIERKKPKTSPPLTMSRTLNFVLIKVKRVLFLFLHQVLQANEKQLIRVCLQSYHVLFLFVFRFWHLCENKILKTSRKVLKFYFCKQ